MKKYLLLKFAFTLVVIFTLGSLVLGCGGARNAIITFTDTGATPKSDTIGFNNGGTVTFTDDGPEKVHRILITSAGLISGGYRDTVGLIYPPSGGASKPSSKTWTPPSGTRAPATITWTCLIHAGETGTVLIQP